MPKLKLKRTPEEEAQHRLRKERRREKKRKHEEAASSSSKRARAYEDDSHVKWASSDEDDVNIGPMPPDPSNSSSHGFHQPHAHKANLDELEAEIENRLFREKMFDAMGDDERLDTMEARLNDYAHVPDRWRTGSGKSRSNVFEGDDFLKLDPSIMDDEEYAEWIRAGMYRKTHAEEYAEQQRKKQARAARRAEEKARKAETARLEKEAEEERKRKKLEREQQRYEWAREEYNARWARLLASVADATSENIQDANGAVLLSFDDIPWPVAAAYHKNRHERRHREKDSSASPQSITIEELTADAITSFLLPVRKDTPSGTADVDQAARKKERKDKLRETFLRFHPDKFEGRFMKRIKKDEHEKVKDAIGQVSRALNSLIGDG